MADFCRSLAGIEPFTCRLLIESGRAGCRCQDVLVAEVLAVGTVWSVEPVGTGSSTSRVWVALLVPADTQGVVAQAAADGLLRLSLLGADG